MEKLDKLNSVLVGVENKLMQRAIVRDRAELDHAYDFINDAADAGVISIDCADCGGQSGADDEE